VAASAVNFYPLRLVILCNRNKRLSGLQNRHKLFLLYFLLWSWRGSFLNWERERGESDSIEGERGREKVHYEHAERGVVCVSYISPSRSWPLTKRMEEKRERFTFFRFRIFCCNPSPGSRVRSRQLERTKLDQ
jgi:hypothetical protein